VFGTKNLKLQSFIVADVSQTLSEVEQVNLHEGMDVSENEVRP